VEASLSQLNLSGVELELREIGAGPPLLFLHGGDGIDGTEEFCEFLQEKYRVIMPSHPGFGGSSLPNHYSSVSDLGFFYLDMMKHLDLRDVLLVGVSFGAWIAADIATKSTSRIRGLVLAGALGVKFSDPRTREIKDLFSMPRAEMDQWLVNREELKHVDRSSWCEEALLRAARNHESFGLFAWSPTLHDPKLKYRLHRLDRPTQIIWGEQDRVVSTEYGKQISACIREAKFRSVPGAGHYVHRDNPEVFAAAVEEFATQISPKG
jgi:pimeloyl-ACP methyl ester carboxylesterase